jgi:hypothetical protein
MISYMEMMNSYSIVIPFKYLVFNLELSQYLKHNCFDLRFALNLKLVGSECLI